MKTSLRIAGEERSGLLVPYYFSSAGALVIFDIRLPTGANGEKVVLIDVLPGVAPLRGGNPGLIDETPLGFSRVFVHNSNRIRQAFAISVHGTNPLAQLKFDIILDDERVGDTKPEETYESEQ